MKRVLAGLFVALFLMAGVHPASAAGTEGGYSFNSATPLGNGTVRQQLVVGEHLFWRVEVKAGQKLMVKAGVDLPAGYRPYITDAFGLEVYNPERKRVYCGNNAGLMGRDPGGKRFEQGCGPWNISADASADHLPGVYYVQVAIREASDEAKGTLAPIDLTVEVTGEPAPGTTAAPDFGGSAPGAPPVAAAPSALPSAVVSAPPIPSTVPVAGSGGDDDGLSTGLTLAIAGGALAVGLTGGYFVRRSRSSSPAGGR